MADIPRRVRGRAGESVSAIGLGGAHIGLPRVDEALSLRIIRSAIERGITFLDNCWDYHDARAGRAWGRRFVTVIAGRSSS